MLNLKSKFLAITAALLCAGAAFAQDSGPLIDLLVKKGIINNQEGEDLRVELTKDFVANTSAGKLNLSSSIADFKLSGDMRMRYEYNNQAPEIAAGGYLLSNETSRTRFRFRLHAVYDIQIIRGQAARAPQHPRTGLP